MKTLNEVISTMEKFWVCPSSDEADEYCELLSIQGDALHYLKEYQERQENLDQFETYQFVQNLPLTWDELLTMKGKPVWIEDNIDEPEDLKGYWAIYRRIDKAQTTEYALLSDLFYDKAEYGKSWQAYRKERE